MDCPDEHTLLRYAAGELGPAWVERLDAHIDGCSACTELVAHAVRELDRRPTEVHDDLSEPAVSPVLASFDAMPDAIDRYVLVQRIGSGGMGTVWAAHDPQLDRNVAIKVLRPGSVDRSSFLRQEARALAALTHPNVVQIFAVGSWALPGCAPSVYLVMELVEGEDLRQWCQRPGRTAAEILDAYRQAARGLAAAHAAGLVHRDFKPDNVLIDRETGRVRVTDFGLARGRPREEVPSSGGADATLTTGIVVEEASHTQAGVVMGTPAYMAPEQRDGAIVDARADQYAFCVSLWEALTGRRPGDDREDDDTPRKLPPPRLRRVLQRGLARSPDARFADMPTLARALFEPPRTRVALAAALVLAVPAISLATARSTAATPPRAGLVSSVAAPLASAASLAHGTSLRHAGEYAGAREALSRAHALASGHGVEYVAAGAAIQQVYVVGSIGEDIEGGAEWVRHAETAIARLPPEQREQAEADLATTRGHWLEAAGRTDEAREQFDVALEHVEAVRGLDHPDRVLALNDVGRIRLDSDPELALADLASALVLARTLHGDHDPLVSLVLSNIGALHEHRGDDELAAEYGAAVLAIEELASGPMHPDVARASYNLGVIADALGDDVAAEAAFRRSLQIWSAALGPDHALVGRCYDNLGALFYEAGDLEGGETNYNRALVLYEHTLGPDHPALITPLSGLAEIAMLHRQPDRAVLLAERARTLGESGSQESRSAMTFRLARALWHADRRDAAVARAKEALAEAGANDDPMEDAALFVPEIEAWLASPDDWS